MENNNLWIIAIVAIVAIFGMFFITTNSSLSTKQTTDLAGQSYYYQDYDDLDYMYPQEEYYADDYLDFMEFFIYEKEDYEFEKYINTYYSHDDFIVWEDVDSYDDFYYDDYDDLYYGGEFDYDESYGYANLNIRKDLSGVNSRRPNMRNVKYIILHTTEGRFQGALNTLKRSGTAHYLIGVNGDIVEIISPPKIAHHAGLSMWNGERDISRVSIGIEIEGFAKDKPTSRQQLNSIKNLLNHLKKRYNIPDERVLTHSMVAYGRPNLIIYLKEQKF